MLMLTRGDQSRDRIHNGRVLPQAPQAWGCAPGEDPWGLDEGQSALSLERPSFCSEPGLWGDTKSTGPHPAAAAGQRSVETGHKANREKRE